MDHHSTKRAARLEVFLELIRGWCRGRLLGAWARQDAGSLVGAVEVTTDGLWDPDLRGEGRIVGHTGKEASLGGRFTGHCRCTLLDPSGPVVYLRAVRCLVLASGTCRAGWRSARSRASCAAPPGGS